MGFKPRLRNVKTQDSQSDRVTSGKMMAAPSSSIKRIRCLRDS